MDKTVASFNGFKIERVEISKEGDCICLYFPGDVVLRIHDTTDCCEYRYMTTDDDLTWYNGATLLGVEVLNGPEIEIEHGGVHETQFLRVRTSAGWFTIETHNEHNGYYGGFNLRASVTHPAYLGVVKAAHNVGIGQRTVAISAGTTVRVKDCTVEYPGLGVATEEYGYISTIIERLE